MFSAIASEPVSSVASVANYRPPTPGAERNVLPQAAPAAPSAQNADGRQSQTDSQKPPVPTETPRGSSTMFAAAVISGTLSPTPKSAKEVYQRIGIAPISSEFEGKLKDLSA